MHHHKCHASKTYQQPTNRYHSSIHVMVSNDDCPPSFFFLVVCRVYAAYKQSPFHPGFPLKQLKDVDEGSEEIWTT